MAAHPITETMNLGHLRTLAEFCAGIVGDSIPITEEQRSALNALAHVTAGPVSGNPLREALENAEGEAKLVDRATILAEARKTWIAGANDELSISDQAAISTSKDDGQTVNGYWVEAYVYVSASDISEQSENASGDAQ